MGSTEVSPPRERQIVEVVARLRRRYPRERISAADIEDRVRDAYRQFDAAHIQTFVAILVERLVRLSID